MRLAATLALLMLLVAPLAVCPPGAAPANAAAQLQPVRDGPCPPPAKAYKCRNAAVVPQAGSFTLPIAGTSVRLRGVGTRQAAGVQIYAARVTAPHLQQHTEAFKVFASGRFPPLAVADTGQLFRYVPSRGTWVRVKAVTTTGIYAIAQS